MLLYEPRLQAQMECMGAHAHVCARVRVCFHSCLLLCLMTCMRQSLRPASRGVFPGA